MTDPHTSLIRRQLADLGRGRAAHDGGRGPRVLIIGNFGNGNTGDEAMLARTLQELPCDVEVRVLSRNPRMVEALHQVPAAPMGGVAFTRALHWCDGIAVVGGGLFGSGASPLVKALPAIIWSATARGRDIAYVAIGVYPGTPGRVLDLLRRSVRKPGRITVRDETSAATLGDAIVAPVVGDLAMGLVPASPADARRALAAAGVDPAVPLLLVAPKALPNPILVDALQDVSAMLGRRWIERGGTVAGLAIGTHADYGLGLARRDEVLIGEIGERLGRPVPVLGPQLAPALAKAVVGEADALFGMRLHALVFAVSTGVPCLGVAWEERITAFLAEHEQSAISTRPQCRSSRPGSTATSPHAGPPAPACSAPEGHRRCDPRPDRSGPRAAVRAGRRTGVGLRRPAVPRLVTPPGLS